jgi:integrase
MQQACKRLHLTEHYVPHSLRHGCATLLARMHWPIEDIMHRGRWAAHKSVRAYIQRARGLLLRQQVPEQTHRLGSHALLDLPFAFSLAQEHFVRGGRTLSSSSAGKPSAASS